MLQQSNKLYHLSTYVIEKGSLLALKYISAHIIPLLGWKFMLIVTVFQSKLCAFTVATKKTTPLHPNANIGPTHFIIIH